MSKRVTLNRLEGILKFQDCTSERLTSTSTDARPRVNMKKKANASTDIRILTGMINYICLKVGLREQYYS
jgi:hypothetical protein